MPAKKNGKSTGSGTGPQPGERAPDFRLPSDDGREVALSELRGKKVVLYFYPKDDTPGCTKEACAFRDGSAEIARRGAVVFGVSADSVASHRKFREKFHLNFPLLSDESRAVCEAYGVWQKKTLYGRVFKGIVRTTFLIDEAGRIARVFPKVSVAGHFDEVIAALDGG